MDISISVGINVLNVIFKLVLVKLVEFIRQDTKSAQMNLIKMGVFTTQFFTTGLLLLISGLNLSESEYTLFRENFQGPYTDFNSQWFQDVSPIIVMALLIGSFMPIVEFSINWVTFQIMRGLDRRFSGDQYVSKKQSIQLYINTYSGPEYLIHYRYSTLMNTIFVSLLYGTALPILYPIALLSMCVLYTAERVQVFYFYKQPPALDEKLTMSTLKVMMLAPVMYMFANYMYLGNQQIFGNVTLSLSSIDDIIRSGHKLIISYSDIKVDQSFPALMLTLVFVALIPFGSILTLFIDKLFPGFFGVNISVDEDLKNYFTALDQDDRHWIIAEEQHTRDNYVRYQLLLTSDTGDEGHAR